MTTRATMPPIDAGRSLNLAGHTLWVRDSGTEHRPVLLCLHGFPSSGFDYARLWPVLTEQYRLLIPDLLGLGRSAKPYPHRYSIAEQADLIEALLQHLQIKACLVLAHDYGDTVAQELLARQLEPGHARTRLQAVTLLNGGLFPEAHRARVIQRLLARPWLGALLARCLGARAFERNMRGIFGPNTPPDAAFLKQTWADLINADGRRVLPALLSYLAERRQHRQRYVQALVDAKVPIRFIVGLADPISGAHMADRYQQLIPNADIVRLDDIGHYPQWEAPHAVLQAILPFFASVTRD